ncbi:MAG: sigma-70 family RNA polymerase sigma factor [Lachnospiraceae bacterium]|nr:sigma-70 family RNA polymerase sigma factor [Lachnospiraceae bacterium]MBQ5559784.1 sigma-70 family RNA polymerase sigma factor [Lachnospiraceae bacterium]MBQ9808843.1 sigma-70 family RNA polymerase sigma factor [Ruminococcus sp.]
MRDRKIIKLIEKRDEKGLEALSEKYEKLLTYIATGILGSNVEDIEECVNDTYLKIWNHIHEFDLEKASFKTYLSVIVRNTSINRLRKISRMEGVSQKEELSELAADYVDQRQNVEAALESKENMQALTKVIEGLKKKDKEMVLRRYYYMQSSKEIAFQMGMSVNAVDSKLSRLRKQMKQQYEILTGEERMV